MDILPPALADIEQAIRRYLRAHPQAFDTERGICEWWLRGEGSAPAADDVHRVLQHLVEAGALVRVTLPDGQRGYAMRTAHRSRPAGPH